MTLHQKTMLRCYKSSNRPPPRKPYHFLPWPTSRCSSTRSSPQLHTPWADGAVWLSVWSPQICLWYLQRNPRCRRQRSGHRMWQRTSDSCRYCYQLGRLLSPGIFLQYTDNRIIEFHNICWINICCIYELEFHNARDLFRMLYVHEKCPPVRASGSNKIFSTILLVSICRFSRRPPLF